MTKLEKTVVFVALLVAVGVGLYAFKPAKKPQPKQTQLAPVNVSTVTVFKPVLHLPPPKVTPVPPEMAEAKPKIAPPGVTNSLARILKGDCPKLTTEQARKYLEAHGRTAATLLAAFKASGAPEFLREAMREFPNDPQVAFAAVTAGKLSADEQRQWLEAFEKADPNNALPNYLSALAWFNAGDSAKAAEEMLASAGKTGFQDYTWSSLADIQQAYLSAGFSEAEAMAAATTNMQLPLLGNLRQLGTDMVNLANNYQQNGDAVSAQSVLLMAANLGQYFADTSGVILEKLIGLKIEERALESLPASASYGATGQTVQDALNVIQQQIDFIKHPYPYGYDDLLHSLSGLSEQDVVQYFRQVRQNGELAAMQWLANRNAHP
jgi:hypothetical protein